MGNMKELLAKSVCASCIGRDWNDDDSKRLRNGYVWCRQTNQPVYFCERAPKDCRFGLVQEIFYRQQQPAILSKHLCVRCLNRFALKGWSEGWDDAGWKERIVFCPDGRQACVNEMPPSWCPFAVEHIAEWAAETEEAEEPEGQEAMEGQTP